MKTVLALAVFACVAALTLADGYGYRPQLRRVYGGLAAPYNNAERQEAVNDKAEYKGAGTGTADEEGVPGTGLNFGYYGHGYDHHNDGYGYNRGYGYGRDYGYGDRYNSYNRY